MKNLPLLESESMAWALGIIATAALATFAFSYVGWLGIGLVGMAGLVITSRLDLFGEPAVPDIGHGRNPVTLYAEQLERQRAQTSPEEKMRAAARRAKRERTLYAINTALIAMTAFGMGLFFLHQF
jgi:hypothetical protein